MQEDISSQKLQLLLPVDLGTISNISMSDQDKAILAPLLNQVSHLVHQPLPLAPENTQLMADLRQQLVNRSSAISIEITSTEGLPKLHPWEAQDYDTYFDVQRVEVSDPIAGLILGFLDTFQVFLELYEGIDREPDALERIAQGFKTYISLLSNLCQ